MLRLAGGVAIACRPVVARKIAELQNEQREAKQQAVIDAKQAAEKAAESHRRVERRDLAR